MVNALDELWDVPEWRNRAACRGQDRVMLPRGREGGGTVPGIHDKITKARAICAQCTERAPCLEYALTCGGQGGPAKEGVWAGYVPEELQAIARARRLGRST